MPSPDAGLRTLTNEDFAELEKKGRRELSPEIRGALNRHLLHLCGPYGDRLVGRQARRASRTKELRQLREDISRLAQDSQRMQEEFASLRSWFYHRNALTQPLFSSEETLISDGLDALVQRAQRESTNDYLHKADKPGPKPNEWYRAFFFGAADVFQQAGGHVNAAAQRDKGGATTRRSSASFFSSTIGCPPSEESQRPKHWEIGLTKPASLIGRTPDRGKLQIAI